MRAVAYDEELADRAPAHLAQAPVTRITEQEMFGGISFMIAGNMCCGVLDNDLVVRIDPTLHHDALTRPDVSEFVMGGRSSRGMIRVGPAGVEDDLDLALWLRLGIAHATALPPKKAGNKKAAAKKKAPPAKKKTAVKRAVPVKKRPVAVKKKRAVPVKKRAVPVKKAKAATKKKAAPPRTKRTAVKKRPLRRRK